MPANAQRLSENELLLGQPVGYIELAVRRFESIAATRANHLPEDRDGFRFRGGCNAIDLPATLQARLSPSPRELLNSPDDLARWLVSAGLASRTPKTTAKDLARFFGKLEPLMQADEAQLQEAQLEKADAQPEKTDAQPVTPSAFSRYGWCASCSLGTPAHRHHGGRGWC